MDRTVLITRGKKIGTSLLPLPENHFVKKTAIILYSIMLICFMISGCQKAKEPEQKKEINVQREKIEQPLSSKTKPDTPSKQREQPPIKPLVKEVEEEEKKNIPVEIRKALLTEEEQREFSRWRDEWDGRTLSEKNALKYLSILVRGSGTVKWYSDRKLWGTGHLRMIYVGLLVSCRHQEAKRDTDWWRRY